MRPVVFWSLCWLLTQSALAQEPAIDPVGQSGPDAGGAAHSEVIHSEVSSWWPHRSSLDRLGVELGVLGLQREKPDSQVVAINQVNAEILNADQFQGDLQFGLNAKVDFYRLWNALGGTDLQFGYFGINSMDATATVNAPQVLPIFFNSVPVSPSNTSSFIYSTNLYSGEANLRFMSRRRFRPIVGLRYLKVEDQFDAFESINGTSVGGFSKTNNSLFGGQVGIEGTLLRWRSLDWIASGKYGAMHNKIYGSARAADSTGTGVVRDFDDTTFASLAEVQTGIRYNFVSGLDLLAAYQCLFISDMAQGLDQNQAIPLFLPIGEVDLNSQLYHGVNLSAAFSF